MTTKDARSRAAHREYTRRRTRQIAYGRWEPWADAGPIRDHVRRLRHDGASYRAIASAAGVSQMTVHNLMNGSRHRGHHQLPSRIGTTQARRLTAVTAGGCGQWRNACGSRRRLQALTALGHPPSSLARQLGLSPPCLRRLLRGETQRVNVTLHADVNVLYTRLWDQMPSEATGRERRAADLARVQAETAGWPPPMALDDDRIDDPVYRPRTAWRQAVGIDGRLPDRSRSPSELHPSGFKGKDGRRSCVGTAGHDATATQPLTMRRVTEDQQGPAGPIATFVTAGARSETKEGIGRGTRWKISHAN